MTSESENQGFEPLSLDRKPPWPRRSDIAFGPGKVENLDPRTIACVDRLLSRPNLGIHADAFKQAADMIVTSLSEGRHDPSPCDVFFFPIAYLYRHAIELLLKDAIGYDAIRLCVIPHSEQLDKILYSHDLYSLWNQLKPAIDEVWPDSEADSTSAAERGISQFHQLDRSGQAFRYPTGKDGSPSIGNGKTPLELVDLEQLANVAGGLCAFLDGCISGFMEALSNMPGRLVNHAYTRISERGFTRRDSQTPG